MNSEPSAADYSIDIDDLLTCESTFEESSVNLTNGEDAIAVCAKALSSLT